jgi:hypothetical protein
MDILIIEMNCPLECIKNDPRSFGICKWAAMRPLPDSVHKSLNA